ncbi:MAG: 2-dehydropantoate 2-reductase [Gammaproteobacteria bacterium]|nr:2-dehydropantoate 2-reductase [Gammaproteobacteria bacterium]MDH3537221.1 2-dehydropantoate 2-reductase [Gammaproteobacteria bacterium]
MKIAILGAGAMGSWFGGRLALAGHEVNLLTTNRAHRDAINSNGLILKSARREECVDLPALDPGEFSGPAEVIILFTKSFQSDGALRSIATALDDNTHILTLQNGLGNAEIVSRYAPLERVMIGVTMMPVDKVGPGIVESTGEGGSHFNAALDIDLPIVAQLEAAFKAAGLDVQIDPDIHRRIWSKVAFNAGMNAVCALAHGTPGTIADSPGAQALVNKIASEVAAVAGAEGITLDLNEIRDTIDYACKNHRDHKPSMHQDLLHARRTEVDALNAAIVAAGERLDVPTPLNSILATLVRVAELSHQRYYST